MAVLFLVSIPAMALVQKDRQSALDAKTFILPELRLPAPLTDLDTLQGFAQAAELTAFRLRYGDQWSAWIDERRNTTGLLTGGAIPFIPGNANTLQWAAFEAGCQNASCISAQTMETLTMEFLVQNQKLLGVNPDELELLRGNLGPVEHMYYVSYRQVVDGIPVEGTTVNFRINHGNLIQVSTSRIAPVRISTVPSIDPRLAVETVMRHIDDFPAPMDKILDPGSLLLIPMTPRGKNPDGFDGAPGSGIDHALVYRILFEREGVIGRWEALVDAHSGELIRFVDTNRYGKARGVVYPGDGHNNPAERVFSFAHLSDGSYTNEGGFFTGDSATIDFGLGKYTHIVDACGSTALTTTDGDANWGQSVGTDCGVPSPNPGGPGNTWSAKVQFYHLTAINMKARSFYPTHTWLNNNYIICNVNGNAWCNATSGSGTLNFYKTASPCWNLGELPGVALHEWSHSWDDLDNSGSTSPPLETRSDWTAAVMIQDSCMGRGAGFTCGYADNCTNCDGVRDHDWFRHSYGQPFTWANRASWGPCTGGSYFGPCGGEDHCESCFASQALWDMVKGPNPSAGPQGDFFLENGLDGPSGWILNDRLWWTSHLNLSDMYSCVSNVTSGCGADTLYTLFMAIDDDGDGVANGTPHAHGIFTALNRHGIACGADGDAANQNHISDTCPTLAQVTNVAVATGSNQLTVTWDAVPDATSYEVFRNESGCSMGFTRVGQPATNSFLDTTCVNGITYYYRVQAYHENGSACTGTFGPVSDCVNGTPQPCAGAVNLSRALYSCNDQVDVTVLDSTLTEPVTVEFWSTTDGTHKSVTLTNNPPGSASYTGHFHTVPSGAGADQVNVADGATVTVRFTDPDYCGAGSQNIDTAATIDCVGPVISNVQVSAITDSTATVTWNTNEVANSRVTYGTSVPPGTNEDDLTHYVTGHSIGLSGLTGCTDYRFSVTSADTATNSTTHTNGGAYFPFKTYGRVFTMGPDDVEGGVSNWIVSGTPNAWHISTCRASSGTHSWKAGNTSCSTDYSINSSNYLTWSQDIDLGAAGHGALLRWMEWYDTESGYDYCRPQISTNGGGTWTTLGTQYAGTSNGWIQKEIDLAAYSGNIRIRFYFYSDGSQVGEGWYIDDINISRSAPCGPELHHQSHGVTDDCAAGGAGDGDGVLDAGETAVVQVTAVNTGTQPATGVTATLSTVTVGVAVTDGSAMFPDIAENGGTGVSAAPHFTITVDPAVVCGTTIDFTLEFTSVEGTWTDAFSLTVGDPVPGNFTLVDEDFEGGWGPTGANPPAGWTIIDNGDQSPPVWDNNDWYNYAKGAPYGNVARVYYSPTENQDEWLISPAFDIPGAATSASFEFDHYYNDYDSADFAYVKYRSEQHPSWVTLATYSTDQGTTTAYAHVQFDLASYIGDTNAQVAFHYIGYYGWQWEVDNVLVSGEQPGVCNMNACAASGPNVQYDGAFDPTTTLVELCGDGDGVVEPGEEWRVTVRLKNTGTSQATATMADLAVNGGGVAGTVIAGNPGDFGTIAAGGTATDAFDFRVDAGAACGNDLIFDVVNISSTEKGYPSQTAAFTAPVGIVSGGGDETRTQQTTPLNASNSTANSDLGPAGFTLALADAATLSYTQGYMPGAGTTTLYGPDEFTIDPASNGWTETGSVTLSSAAPVDSCTGGGDTHALIPGGGAVRRGVDTTGRTNVRLVLDYRYASMDSGEGIFVDYSTTGVDGTYTNQWSLTSTGNNQSTAWGDDCARTITFPPSCENNAGFAVRIRNNASNASEAVRIDHLLVTGDQGAAGTWTDNAQVSLVDPSNTVTVLKAYGAADATPYDVQAYYTGPGTYQIRLEESAGGTATITAGSMQVVMNATSECDASSCGSMAPPPVTASGAWAVKFSKGAGDTLNVSYDSTTCSADKAVILYGNLGTWTGYAGCAQNNGGNGGSTTVNSGGQTATWYNVVWTTGTTVGHPGNGTGGVRGWSAAGLCGMSTDDKTHTTCP